MPVTPEEHKEIWSFLGDDYADFFDPLYLTVTCSAFAGGVQDYGRFWKMTSGCFPYPAPVGPILDTCYVSLRRPLVVSTAENCGVSAVAVHQGRRLLLHGAQADRHGLAVQQTTGIRHLQFLNEVVLMPVVCNDRCPGLCCSSTRSSTPCRPTEADHHGPVYSDNQRDTPVA